MVADHQGGGHQGRLTKLGELTGAVTPSRCRLYMDFSDADLHLQRAAQEMTCPSTDDDGRPSPSLLARRTSVAPLAALL